MIQFWWCAKTKQSNGVEILYDMISYEYKRQLTYNPALQYITVRQINAASELTGVSSVMREISWYGKPQ